jgi:hypothetical protein
MRQPKPAPGGFFTDRSPPVISQADQNFKAIVGRYPNATESQLAPRTGHPLEQTIDWSESPLAKAYPQWEVYLFELSQERRNAPLEGRKTHPSANLPLGNHTKRHLESDVPGLSAAQVNQQYGTRERKCDEL